MNKLDSMQAFVQVIESGGFAAAARAMGLSRSQVNKLVANLEDSLGVQLLHRTTRRVTPTDTGLAYYERSLTILADIEAADAAVAELQTEATGTLRINAPLSFGIKHLGPAIATFCQQHPQLQVEVTLTDRFIDPIAEGYDITLRLSAEPQAASLVSHYIAPAPRQLCAAPAYLEQQGYPTHPDDLHDHSCLHYGYVPHGHSWTLYGPQESISVRIAGALCSNNGDVLRSAALQGLGIALLPIFLVGDDLQQGSLVALLSDYRAEDLALYVLYPVNRHLSAKVKVFTEFICDRLGPCMA